MFKNILTILMICLTLSTSSKADQSVPIQQGEKAPFAGVLLDKEKAQKVVIGLEERDLYQQIVESQKRSIELLKQNNTYSENKVNLLLEQNDKLAESLRSAQSMSTFEKIGLVVLGVAITVGAGYAVKQVAK